MEKRRVIYTLCHRELELPHVPERRSVVQAEKDILGVRPCVAILQPTQLNDPPQFVAESQTLCPLWSLRSIPLRNRTDNENI